MGCPRATYPCPVSDDCAADDYSGSAGLPNARRERPDYVLRPTVPNHLADPHTHSDPIAHSKSDSISVADPYVAAHAMPVRLVGRSAELHLANPNARAYAWIDVADNRNQSLLGL